MRTKKLYRQIGAILERNPGASIAYVAGRLGMEPIAFRPIFAAWHAHQRAKQDASVLEEPRQRGPATWRKGERPERPPASRRGPRGHYR